jgi:ribose 5-phosphate isomerase A
MVVIADGSKRVKRLGRFPLPIEVVPFGLGATRRAVQGAIERSGCRGEIRLRMAQNGGPFRTDGEHYILDAHLGAIDHPDVLAAALVAIPGVVEHGLFLSLAKGAILATEAGIEQLGAL